MWTLEWEIIYERECKEFFIIQKCLVFFWRINIFLNFLVIRVGGLNRFVDSHFLWIRIQLFLSMWIRIRIQLYKLCKKLRTFWRVCWSEKKQKWLFNWSTFTLNILIKWNRIQEGKWMRIRIHTPGFEI